METHGITIKCLWHHSFRLTQLINLKSHLLNFLQAIKETQIERQNIKSLLNLQLTKQNSFGRLYFILEKEKVIVGKSLVSLIVIASSSATVTVVAVSPLSSLSHGIVIVRGSVSPATAWVETTASSPVLVIPHGRRSECFHVCLPLLAPVWPSSFP